LNAGAALQLISGNNEIKHFGTDSRSSCSVASRSFTQVGVEQSTGFSRGYFDLTNNFYPQGVYRVLKYEMNIVINHHLNHDERIVESWTRPSSSSSFGDLTPTGQMVLAERLKINSINTTQCSMTGAFYKVFDFYTHQDLGWIPYDPTNNLADVNFEYSVLTQKVHRNGLTEQGEQDFQISIFPNPSNNQNTISLNCLNLEILDIDLFDIQGKLIKSVYKGVSEVGINKFDSNIQELISGVYFYKIKIGSTVKYVKFVKQ
jgi:Secretion system C-terminal sorting domain